MSSINTSPLDNLGSLYWVQWAGTTDFSSITYGPDGTVMSITFAGSNDWNYAYTSFESQEFNEDTADNAATGVYYKQEVKFFIPGENKAQVLALDAMRQKRFVIAMKDFEGNIRLMGTLSEGAKMKIKYDTRSKVNGLKGTAVSFFLESAKRAPFVDSGVLFVDVLVP
jgi:hypothetical protein